MDDLLAIPAVRLALVASGVFFLAGLLTGVWKYVHIHAGQDGAAKAPVYVDIAHRTALFYSFAALLLTAFAAVSAWSDGVNLLATAAPLAFFAAAIGGYVLHGVLGDTDNQFRRPHRIGPVGLPRHGLLAFMAVLTIAEVGGFIVLFAGVLRRLQLV